MMEVVGERMRDAYALMEKVLKQIELAYVMVAQKKMIAEYVMEVTQIRIVQEYVLEMQL